MIKAVLYSAEPLGIQVLPSWFLDRRRRAMLCDIVEAAVGRIWFVNYSVVLRWIAHGGFIVGNLSVPKDQVSRQPPTSCKLLC